jgi:hypothetical protein
MIIASSLAAFGLYVFVAFWVQLKNWGFRSGNEMRTLLVVVGVRDNTGNDIIMPKRRDW